MRIMKHVLKIDIWKRGR